MYVETAMQVDQVGGQNGMNIGFSKPIVYQIYDDDQTVPLSEHRIMNRNVDLQKQIIAGGGLYMGKDPYYWHK